MSSSLVKRVSRGVPRRQRVKGYPGILQALRGGVRSSLQTRRGGLANRLGGLTRRLCCLSNSSRGAFGQFLGVGTRALTCVALTCRRCLLGRLRALRFGLWRHVVLLSLSG